jgi:hypothetical protein
MRTRLLTTFTTTLLFCSLLCNAQNKPKFSFTKTSHDFGNVPKGPDVVVDFEFTNIGDVPLLVTSARGSCSCTKPSFAPEAIAPGASGKITALFETKDKHGTFKKSIYVFSNATDKNEPFELEIMGNVIAPVKKTGTKPPVKKK